jgi:hypothetical protein
MGLDSAIHIVHAESTQIELTMIGIQEQYGGKSSFYSVKLQMGNLLFSPIWYLFLRSVPGKFRPLYSFSTGDKKYR